MTFYDGTLYGSTFKISSVNDGFDPSLKQGDVDSLLQRKMESVYFCSVISKHPGNFSCCKYNVGGVLLTYNAVFYDKAWYHIRELFCSRSKEFYYFS